jgi:4-hydroxy-tetrahydrodipicolinate synthase
VLGEVLTAIVTPFDGKGRVDVAKFRELASHLVENGSDGVVVTGTTGESPTLTDEERFELYAAAVDEVGGRATVVAGTGTYSTAHSIHLTERAHELGVDAFLVVTPYYNLPTPRGIVEHFKAVAATSERRCASWPRSRTSRRSSRQTPTRSRLARSSPRPTSTCTPETTT